MTLTIICPITSRGCPPGLSDQPVFQALLPSMDALKVWGGVRLVFGYDHDDPLWSQPASRAAVTDAEWFALHTKGSLTSTWNELERLAWPWDHLLPANDDLAFETSPLPAVEALESQRGFGTVAFHDHAFPGLPTFYVVGKIHLAVFGALYPLPWIGAHQDPWIYDVYRPWGASEIDERFQVHNRIGITGARFEYGVAPEYQETVASGRRLVNNWLKRNPGIADVLPERTLTETKMIL